MTNSLLNNSSNMTPSLQEFINSIRNDTLNDEDVSFSLTLLPISTETAFVSIIHAISGIYQILSDSLNSLSNSDHIYTILEKISHNLNKGKLIKAGSLLENFLCKFKEMIKINSLPTSNSSTCFRKAKKLFNETVIESNYLLNQISSNLEFGGETMNKLRDLYSRTVNMWMKCLITSEIQIIGESRQEDVVRTGIRSLIGYSRTSKRVCECIIQCGGVECLISVCYSMKEVAYDALKLTVLLCTQFGMEVFVKGGLLECGVSVFVEEYSDVVRMEMALALSALELRANVPKEIVQGLVDGCKSGTSEMVFACLAALCNTVICEPSNVEYVVEGGLLPLLVSSSVFVRDWIACLMALVAKHECYHRHMIDGGCLTVLMDYLMNDSECATISSHVMAITRVLQKTIIALTRLSLTTGVSLFIYNHNGLDRIRVLASDSAARFNCEHVRVAATAAYDFINTRLSIDHSTNPL